jgi:hypothetical protein
MNRRRFIKYLGAGAASLAFPHVWVPNRALAQTSGRGSVKHLVYVYLRGGFRFTTAFNADVAAEFNPFGRSRRGADGTEWGVGELLERAPFLDGDPGQERADLGMRPVNEITDQIAVLPCVDFEPGAARADGNHGTALERFLTGYSGGDTSFFTMINYGLRERVEAARIQGRILLPAFSLGGAGMARGPAEFAAFRPPVMQGDGFDRFGFDADESLPEWAAQMAEAADARMRERLHPRHRAPIEAYVQARESTREYSRIFNDDALKIRNNSDEAIDGISNRELALLLGDDGTGRNLRLALRLFKFGCPAVFLGQGSYDYHSGEEANLPGQIDGMNRMLSGLECALKRMSHPEGGTYWDHTLVVLGSEFSRTARGSRFNSARGSDHTGDYATRWMAMPIMGGPVTAAGAGGRSFGGTRSDDLAPTGRVYGYRNLLKTLMDMLGADHAPFYPEDAPFDDLFR